MAVIGQWKQFIRVRQEASFNAANPQTAQDWNVKAGATGWIDAVDQLDGAGLGPQYPLIFPSGKAGSPFENNMAPVAGALESALGSLTFAVYPELIDRWLRAAMGSVTRTPTAGTAAQASTAFASLASLTTQPSTKEQLKFVIASSTAASGAAINVIQNAVTVETIEIPDSASSVDGDYYTKGAYDGSTNAITFSVDGTVTSGMVTVSGIKLVTAIHKFSTSDAPSLVIEQAGRVEVGAGNSEFFPGCKIPTLNFAYQRTDVRALLLATAGVSGLIPTVATSTTYGDDAAAGSKAGYLPLAAWTGQVLVDDVAYSDVIAANLNLNSNDEHYSASSGNQSPTGALMGLRAFFGTLTVIPSGTTRWDDYKAATPRKIELRFLTPHYINATTPYKFSIIANSAYLETYTRNVQGVAQGAELAIRGVKNSTDGGPCQIETVSRLPV